MKTEMCYACYRFFLSILKRWQKTSNRENKMAARKFSVRHRDSTFDVDYDTADGLEVSPPIPLSLSLSLCL